MKSIFLFFSAFLILTSHFTFAGSATWNLNPISGDWNTATNWTPATVPNGPSDVATFAASSVNEVTFSATTDEVAEVIFDSAATTSFNITAGAGKTFTISGTGVVNNSAVTQNFAIGPSLSGQSGLLNFQNAATAGTTNLTYTAYGAAGNGSNGSGAQFYGNSSAGSATFVAQGATHGLDVGGGFFSFNDNSTAENANFTINGATNFGGFGGAVIFDGFATAANALFVLNPGTTVTFDSGEMVFRGNATAGNGIFTLNGSTSLGTRTEISFGDAATAGNGFFTVMGGQTSGLGGEVLFSGFTFTGLITTAGNATFINNGGNGANAIGGHTSFATASTAAQARLVANGGEDGGGGGFIFFSSDSDGGEAQVELSGNGYLDISSHLSPGITIGSLEGDGVVKLGLNELAIGSNNLSTTFAGVIQDSGSVTKIGTGRLTLSGANTYTGGTRIEAGELAVNNKIGSGTGTGPVQVNAGILSGRGAIAGAVTIGIGNGPGAFLAPGENAKGLASLTIQSALTFKADGTYTYKFNTKRPKGDQVIANGVTIEDSAQFAFEPVANKKLIVGQVFTVINNTAANPIAGTFANLPDDSTFTIGNNTFQADYQGGDGNDLTLTVIP